MFTGPHEVTAEDVERSSLEPSDVGRWALIICGAWHLFDNREAAQQCAADLQE